MPEKFAQWKEYLEETYGKGLFVTRDWMQKEWGRVSGQGSRQQATIQVAESVIGARTAARGANRQPETLDQVRADLGDCKRCKLCEKRKNIAFGEGNPSAQIMFIGEGPGEQEDLQGRPFVGKAGQLLDKIIEAMGFKRSDVYIANVVKCRPPGNRVPEPDEVATCEPFLFRQIDAVNPKVIVALGGTALKCLLHGDVKITQMRGKWMEYRGRRLLPTFHPAFLLRNPESKKDVWEDMRKVLVELGLSRK